MQRYLVQRVLRALLVTWLVGTLVFFGMRSVGDPAELILSQTLSYREEDIKHLRSYLRTDRPLYRQYVTFVTETLRGDFGRAFRSRTPAATLIFARVLPTMQLAGAALLIAFIVGPTLGIIAAMRPNSWVDRAMVTLAVLGQSVPVFWLAIMLIMLFAVRLDWLPATGRGGLDHLILPALCLSTFSIASVARLLRSTMMDVMSEDYIRTAYAKGLSTRTTVLRHALRNAALPVVTVMGLQVVGLLSGVIIVEVVFVWRGMGDLMVNAILFRDFPIVQGAVLIFAVIAVVANLVVDIVYAYIDPRVRYA